jgi:plastocyanin
MRRPLVLAVLGLIALTSPAGGQSDPTVAVQLFQFRPGTLAVKTGARVIWVNADDIGHTVTAGAPERREGHFDLPLPGKGARAAVTLKAAGRYPYFCERHPHMRGEIRVD